MKRFLLNDPFLKTLLPEQASDVEVRFEHWELNQSSFEGILDNWFGNFNADDKPLALKLFLNIDYYGPTRFLKRIEELNRDVLRSIHELELSEDAIILVTPQGQGDSGNRHAYDSHKTLNLPRERIFEVQHLRDKDLSQSVLVLFNDTHGSGNQFLKEIWPYLKTLPRPPKRTILLAINIAEEAQKTFQQHIPEVIVVPDMPALSAKQVFTAEEYKRIRQLGEKVYPKHPLGYGGTGLLAAYYFQCPNNSLPLIWANGDNNSIEGKRGYPWVPLFPYVPKPKSRETVSKQNTSKQHLVTSRQVERVSPPVSSSPDVVNKTTLDPFIVSPKSVFLHYLDHYFLEMKAVSGFSGRELLECRRATRYALLAAEELLVPAAAYFESPLCRRVIDEYRQIFDSGKIWLIGAGANLLEYLQQKLVEYPKESSHSEAYLKGLKAGRRYTPPFRTRSERATEQIVSKWNELSKTDLPYKLITNIKDAPKEFERLWQQVPERLGSKPFIVEYVEPILVENAPLPFLTNALHTIVNAAYYEGFTKEFHCGLVTDLVFLHSSMHIESYSTNIPYSRLLTELRKRRIDQSILEAPVNELMYWKLEKSWTDSLYAALHSSYSIDS